MLVQFDYPHEIGRRKYRPGESDELPERLALQLIALNRCHALATAPPIVRLPDPVIESAPDKMLHETDRAGRKRTRRK